MDKPPVLSHHGEYKCAKFPYKLAQSWVDCDVKLFQRGKDWVLSTQRKTARNPDEVVLTRKPRLIKSSTYAGGGRRVSLEFEMQMPNSYIKFKDTEMDKQDKFYKKFLEIAEVNRKGPSVKPLNSYQSQNRQQFTSSTSASAKVMTPVKAGPVNNQETPTRVTSQEHEYFESFGDIDDHNYFEKENIHNGSELSEKEMKTPTNDGKQFLQRSLAKSTSSLSSQSFYSSSGGYTGNTVPRTYASRKPGLLPDPEKKRRHKLADLSNNSSSVKYSWNRPKPSPSPTVNTPLLGFSNLGNTCYMNAILQSLFKLEPFASNLADFSDDTRYFLSEDEQREKLLFVCLAKLLKMQMMQQYVSFEKKREVLSQIKNVISNCAKRFSGHGQHDAHEFLSLVLDQVKEEAIDLWKRKSPSKLETLKSVSEAAESPEANESEEETLDGKNPITANFEFDVLHSITCKGCRNCVEKAEKFNDLSVDMPRRRNLFSERTERTLQDAVDQFFKKEKIEYKCELCECKEATVEHKFLRLPRILVLHLKRYQFQSRSYAKVGQDINIPKYLTLQSQCYEETLPPSPSPKPYRPINEVIKPKFQFKQTSSPATAKNSHRESKWNKYLPEEKHSGAVTKTYSGPREKTADEKFDEVVGKSHMDERREQKQPSETAVDDSDDEAFLAIPAFSSKSENKEEHVKTEEEAIKEALEKSMSETGPTANYNELIMENMSEEEQLKLALQRSLEESPLKGFSEEFSRDFSEPTADNTDIQSMDLCEPTELCTSNTVYISSPDSDSDGNSNVCKNNNFETEVWPPAIVSSVDGTWDTDLDQESTDSPNNDNSDTMVVKDRGEPPAKKLRSMLEAGKEGVFGPRTPPRDKISTVTNSKLQSLLTQRSGERTDPDPAAQGEVPGEVLGAAADLEGTGEQTVPEVETRGDILDLTIDDKENKTPPKETPTLSDSSMTEDDKRKKEDAELQRAIELSLEDQDALELITAEQSSLEVPDDDEEALAEDPSLSMDDEERKERDEILKQNADTGDLPYSYQLMSVVSHLGKTSSVGHYISDIYDIEKKSWTSCNDSELSQVSEDTVRKCRQKSGYIFFYLHRDLVDELENYFKEAPSSSTASSKSTAPGSAKKDARPLSR